MTGFKHIPFDRVSWITTSFLSITLLLALTAAPAYLIMYGMGGFMAVLFAFYLIATGLSITLGYHRLFAHLSFGAKWPVRMFVLLFGAAAWGKLRPRLGVRPSPPPQARGPRRRPVQHQ